MMMEFWLFAPGLLLYLGAMALTLIGALTSSRSRVLLALRLRFLGLGLMFLLPGTHLVVSGLVDGIAIGSLLMGLVFLGFGALWLYARGGIGPNFPKA
jgi:hypothetical protein